MRQAFFNTLEKRTADATRRKAILKECIPFGLQEFERRETAELSQQLAEELNALQLSLQAGGCSEGEAKHQASERLSDTHKQHLRALEASQKNVGPELIALLKADAVEDIMRLNTASASILSPEQRQEEEHRVNSTRDSAIISLSVGLNSVMEKRSSSAQLTDNLSRREAAAVEEKMWASAEVEAAAIRQRLENAIDQSHDDGMMKLRRDYDKALNGLEVAYQVSKQTQKKNLLNRINLRKEQRRRELEQQRGLNESEARNQVSAEFCDDAQRVADLEARIEQEKVIAIAEQEDLVEDSLSGSKHPSTALSGKEDMEASILLQKLMQDETNFLKTGGDDAFTTATAQRNAAKSSLQDNEARFAEMKAQYERDISRIKDEFETQKKNELDELKHNADQQLAAFVSGGGDGDGDAKQRLEALKLRNDEELKSLQDSIAVDKRAQKKSLQARLAANNLKKKQAEALQQAEGDHQKIDELENQTNEEMQALQNQVLADLEKESTEELERNLKHIRETAQRETREKIMDMEKQHAEEAAALAVQSKEGEMDAAARASYDEQLVALKQRNDKELEKLKNNVLVMKKAKEENLKARLTEKARQRKELATASITSSDDDHRLKDLSDAVEQSNEKDLADLQQAHAESTQQLEANHLTSLKRAGDKALSERDAELRRAEEKAIFDRKKELEERMKSMIDEDYLAAQAESGKAGELVNQAQDRVADLKREHEEELRRLKEQVEVEKKAKIVSKTKARFMGLRKQMVAKGMLKKGDKQHTGLQDAAEHVKQQLAADLALAEQQAQRTDLDAAGKAEAMRKVSEIKRRNDEELKSLEDGIAVDKKMKEKRLKARLVAKNLKKQQAESMAKAIAQAKEASEGAEREAARKELEAIEQHNHEEIQALQKQVLAELEEENAEELERNLQHVREAAEREARERIEELEKQHTEESVAQLLKSKQEGMDDASFKDQLAAVKKRNEEELAKLKDNIAVMKKAKVNNLKARLAEKNIKNRQLALSSVTSSDDEDPEEGAPTSVLSEAQADADRKLEEMERVHAESMAAAMLETRQLEVGFLLKIMLMMSYVALCYAIMLQTPYTNHPLILFSTCVPLIRIISDGCGCGSCQGKSTGGGAQS